MVKRSSFIEVLKTSPTEVKCSSDHLRVYLLSLIFQTGFVETLKANFTPGQPLSPSLSMAIEERVTGIQLQHENDNLKAEIRDLNEKIDTLKSLVPFTKPQVERCPNFSLMSYSSQKSR